MAPVHPEDQVLLKAQDHPTVPEVQVRQVDLAAQDRHLFQVMSKLKSLFLLLSRQCLMTLIWLMCRIFKLNIMYSPILLL